jgi:peroxiredoxin
MQVPYKQRLAWIGPVLSILSCALLAMGCAAPASEGNLEVGIREGQLAPDFELKDLEDQAVKLSDYRGQVVLINFWATWCSYCRTEFPDLQRAYEGNRDKGFIVLAVNVQDRKESVQAYAQELGLTFPVLLDPLGRASGPYKARGLPTSYFVDQRGVIVLKKVGPVNESIIDQVLARAGVE